MLSNKFSVLLFSLASFATLGFAQTKPVIKKNIAVQSNKIAAAATKPNPQISNNKMIVHPSWCLNKTIYEVNLRQYSEKSSFKNFEKEIPRLKKMGVDILWFMPIHPIGKMERKGTLGSYYAVQNYTDVSPEYGNMDDFKSMVNAIHSAGMKIIIDWVANHTAPDNIWTKEHRDFYTKDKNGKFVPPVADWSDVIDLNYDNKEMRMAMIDAMKFWLIKTDIDGFRCDVAEMVPTDFWINCRTELDKVKPVFMLAEGEKPELHKAFDMTYTWNFYHTMKGIIKGEKKRSDLIAYFEQQKKDYSKNDIRMYFTSNHDENTWNATEFEAFGDAHKTVAAIAATLPGMPLIYSGQEAAQTKHLKFFDKDVIEWGNYSNADFYTILNKLRKSSRALLPAATMEIIDSKNNNLFVYKRISGTETILMIANLSKENQGFIPAENSKGTYSNVIDGFNLDLIANAELTLEPYQFLVLQKFDTK